jgi:hypothetical protein
MSGHGDGAVEKWFFVREPFCCASGWDEEQKQGETPPDTSFHMEKVSMLLSRRCGKPGFLC